MPCRSCATRLATDAGGRRQIGRAGLPMIWPVFRDADSDASSQANETHPTDDPTNYGKAFRDLVAATIARLGASAGPDACADAVVRRLLPDLLPCRVGTPAVFGFSGFNGRSLGDNAPGRRPEHPTPDFPYVVPDLLAP